MSDKKCVGKIIKKNDQLIHPFNLNIIENLEDKSICPTKVYFDSKNNRLMDRKYSNKNPAIEEIINYMDKPYVYIDHNYLLKEVFNIKEVDDIEKWIEENSKKPMRYISRVVNLWIKSNLKDIKKYNQLLVKILKSIFNFKNNKSFNIEKFVKKWTENINENDFFIDIFEDINKFI